MAPLPGRILRVKTSEGEQVVLGSPLLVIEAIKMENEISSPETGQIVETHVSGNIHGCETKRSIDYDTLVRFGSIIGLLHLSALGIN